MNKLKLIIGLIAVLLLMACGDDDIVRDVLPKEEATILNVGTYNIRYLTSESDKNNNWSERKSRLYELVRQYKFEIFGVQEVTTTQAGDLVADLPEYTYYGKSRKGENGEQVGILYNADRFEVLDQGFFWLSETPDKSSIGWDASVERVCVWMKLNDTKTNLDFYFYATHYDHIGEKARLNSSNVILQHMEENTEGSPTFLVGDLNTKPASLPVTKLKTVLGDSWYKTLEAPIGTATFNNFNVSETFRPTQRIDYIFSSANVEVYSCHTIDDKMGGGNYPSDHFPILIEAALKSDKK